ncbi:MAG TPA: hypothetical protein VMR90_16420 [Candidatus Cybelea sp.]|nr:hypothetical protein [Candidatus Cybelea sp.]
MSDLEQYKLTSGVALLEKGGASGGFPRLGSIFHHERACGFQRGFLNQPPSANSIHQVGLLWLQLYEHGENVGGRSIARRRE